MELNIIDVFQATEKSERTALSIEQLTNENKTLKTQVSRYNSDCTVTEGPKLSFY